MMFKGFWALKYDKPFAHGQWTLKSLFYTEESLWDNNPTCGSLCRPQPNGTRVSPRSWRRRRAQGPATQPSRARGWTSSQLSLPLRVDPSCSPAHLWSHSWRARSCEPPGKRDDAEQGPGRSSGGGILGVIQLYNTRCQNPCVVEKVTSNALEVRVKVTRL